MSKGDDDRVETQAVECTVCMTQIPPSVAVYEEADDYVYFFCGPECHAQWEQEQAGEVERAFEEHSGTKRP